MSTIREKLQGWKTTIAAISAISGVWLGFFNEAVTLEAAITTTVVAIIGLTVGAKIDRAT